MTEALGLGVLDAVKFKHIRLLLIAVPDVLAVLAPSEDDRLGVEFPVGTHQRRTGLLPDKTCADLEARILESIVEHTRLHRCVEFVDGSIQCHGFFEVGVNLHQKLIGGLIIKVIVLDAAGCILQLHEVRCIGADQIDLGITQQRLIHFRISTVAADDCVFAQMPDVAGLGEAGLLQFFLHIEVILFGILVIDAGKQLVDLGAVKAGKVGIELSLIQITDQISQKLFVPCTCHLVHGNVQCLFLVLTKLYHNALDFRLAHVLENRKSLMSRNDRVVVCDIDHDQLNIPEVLNGVLQLLKFRVAGLELLPGVVFCRIQFIQLEFTDNHIFHTHCALSLTKLN